MRVDIEHIQYLLDERKKINVPDLADIEFFLDNRKVEISEDVIENFKFTGLNNIDFIATGAYLDEY